MINLFSSFDGGENNFQGNKHDYSDPRKDQRIGK